MAIEPAPREQHAPRRSIIRHVMFSIAVAWFCCFHILLVALLAVLAEQRLDVLERGGFERLEPVGFVNLFDDIYDVVSLAYFCGQKITHPAGWVGF